MEAGVEPSGEGTWGVDGNDLGFGDASQIEEWMAAKRRLAPVLLLQVLVKEVEVGLNPVRCAHRV